jgi:hypothetical protein
MAKAVRNEFETFARRKSELTVLTDHPLTDSQTKAFFKLDPFNFRFKLGPVFDILRHPDTKTPTAILISGGWGTGKTSAMKWLHALLNEWNKEKSDDVPNGEYIKAHPVWFYPWKYDNREDVRRGLIAEVIINAVYIRNPENKRVTIGRKKILTGLKLLGSFGLDVVTDLASASEFEIPAIPGLKISGEALNKIREHYKKAAHPETSFLNELEDAMKYWIKESLGKRQRMVIFIDDLDRCMPDIALQVLEALKLYLNIENLIFVLGVDKQVVENLVVEYYKKLGLVRKKEDIDSDPQKEQSKKGAKKEEAKAKQYLSKMFQVEIELSPSEEQISDFFDEQLKEIPYWKKNLSKEHQRLFRGLVLKLAGRNPREVKRILNSALMSGSGIQKIKVVKGKKKPTFEQGLQDFFIRQILQRPYYERVAGMIDMDQGRKFLEAWSQFVLEKKSKDSDSLKEMFPDYLTK